MKFVIAAAVVVTCVALHGGTNVVRRAKAETAVAFSQVVDAIQEVSIEAKAASVVAPNPEAIPVSSNSVDAVALEAASEEIDRLRRPWYEKMSAPYGSKAYWVLRIAKDRASRGEDVSKLKETFDDIVKNWLSK